MYTVLVTAGKILSVFLAWLVTRLHPFHRLHPLRPKWMLFVSFFPLTSLFMLMALFLICRDQRELTQPVAFFCIFLGIANVAIVYVISLIERDTEVKQQINILSQQMEIQTASILALDKAYRQQRQTTHDFQNHLCTISDLLSQKSYVDNGKQENEASCKNACEGYDPSRYEKMAARLLWTCLSADASHAAQRVGQQNRSG